MVLQRQAGAQNMAQSGVLRASPLCVLICQQWCFSTKLGHRIWPRTGCCVLRSVRSILPAMVFRHQTRAQNMAQSGVLRASHLCVLMCQQWCSSIKLGHRILLRAGCCVLCWGLQSGSNSVSVSRRGTEYGSDGGGFSRSGNSSQAGRWSIILLQQ